MNVITELEARLGVSLPPGYHDWSLAGYTNYRLVPNSYLWVHEAEWIPPSDIPAYDLGRPRVVTGLIPFAFNGAGDSWCWNTSVERADAEYDVLCCCHDEELADRFAPSFPAWFYRVCLDYAAGGMDKDEDGIAEARKNLRLWGKRLSEIQPGAWAEHLVSLSDAQPSKYKHPKLRASATMFGFITAMEVDAIVAEHFGTSYLDQKVEWGAWD